MSEEEARNKALALEEELKKLNVEWREALKMLKLVISLKSATKDWFESAPLKSSTTYKDIIALQSLQLNTIGGNITFLLNCAYA